MDRTLDWKPNFDPRSIPFRVSRMDCYARGKTRTNIIWPQNLWLDQGQEGACTGFGSAHVLASTPVVQPDITEALARYVYYMARRWDEWEGEDYEGSSVNGAMKALREMGRIKAWRWVYAISELNHALSWHGAVVAGTDWYSAMWDTDEGGHLHVEGSKTGGHCYKIAGFQTIPGQGTRYRIDNSWGASWGDGGGAWMWEADMNRLLESGEFAVPLKVRM